MKPRLLHALTKNGDAIPNAPMSTPPRAGPIARLTFTPALFAAIAPSRLLRGTNVGTIDCQTGYMSAVVTPINVTKMSRSTGVTRCIATIMAKAAHSTVPAAWQPSRKRRRSNTSANAPARIANTNKGRLAATCTSER
jgi:hypothetical protein